MVSYEIALSFKQFTRFVSLMTALPLLVCSSSNERPYLYNSLLILMHSWRTFFSLVPFFVQYVGRRNASSDF